MLKKMDRIGIGGTLVERLMKDVSFCSPAHGVLVKAPQKLGSDLIDFFSAQSLCSLRLCGDFAASLTTETQRAQRLRRENPQN